MELHPAVQLFPRLSDTELKKLSDDIKKNGLQLPIQTCEGKIIDGRNRLLACQLANVEPTFVEWKGESIVRHVYSMNSVRRQLTASQNAVAGTNMLPLLEAEAKERQRAGGGDKKSARAQEEKGKGKAAGAKKDKKGKKAAGADGQKSLVETIPEAIGGKKARDEAAEITGANPRYIQDAKKIKEEAPDLFARIEAGDMTIPEAKRKLKARKPASKKADEPLVFGVPYEDVDYAKWSWNPVTGCKHGCDYCSARDIVASDPDGFEPTFHADQLVTPGIMKIPAARVNEPGIYNVLVCETGDLFGAWVAQDWVDAVIETVKNNPQWTFIFMTKNVKRYLKIEFPENCWVGATADTQQRAKEALEIFAQLRPRPSVLFLACTPLLENINFGPRLPLDWLIIGARDKSSKLPALQPEWPWVTSLMLQADDNAKMPIYCMPNLQIMIRQTPVLA